MLFSLSNRKLIQFIICISIIFLILLIKYRKKKVNSSLDKKAYTAYYDESHSNVWGLWDTGFYGFSEFALEFKKMQIPITVNTKPIDILLNSIEKKSYYQTILILNVAKNEEYSKKELDKIEQFVAFGGKLFVFGEHDNMYRSSTFQNRLLKKFGLNLNNDHIGRDNVLYRQCFSSYFNLKRIYHQYAASIHIKANRKEKTIILLEDRHKDKIVPIAVGMSFKKGKIFLIGDSELFWNEYPGYGIDLGENRLFLQKVLQWLTGINNMKVLSSYKNINGKKIIFLDTEKNIAKIQLRSFLHFFNLKGYQFCYKNCSSKTIRIIHQPLEKIIPTKQRTILFAESYDRLEPFSFWDHFHLQKGLKNRNSIYKNFEKKHHFRILPCFLTDGREKLFSYDLLFEKSIIKLNRATMIELHDKSLIPWLVKKKKSGWCEFTHPGMADIMGKPLAIDKHDITEGIFAAYSKKWVF